MIPSLEELPTKAKEAPSPHEVRLAPLDTNPVFHSLGGSHNLSFMTGLFPSVLKTAKVAPLFKKDSKLDYSIYHPI